jgi:hypothetical protein
LSGTGLTISLVLGGGRDQSLKRGIDYQPFAANAYGLHPFGADQLPHLSVTDVEDFARALDRYRERLDLSFDAQRVAGIIGAANAHFRPH